MFVVLDSGCLVLLYLCTCLLWFLLYECLGLTRDRVSLFFFNDTATTEIYTYFFPYTTLFRSTAARRRWSPGCRAPGRRRTAPRSEEHTSELQSLMRISYAVFCLKKKIPTITTHNTVITKNDTHIHSAEKKRLVTTTISRR